MSDEAKPIDLDALERRLQLYADGKPVIGGECIGAHELLRMVRELRAARERLATAGNSCCGDGQSPAMPHLNQRPRGETPDERKLRREQILEYGEEFAEAQYSQLAPAGAVLGKVEPPSSSLVVVTGYRLVPYWPNVQPLAR